MVRQLVIPFTRNPAIPRDDLLRRRTSSKPWALTLVVGLLLTACGSIGSEDTEPLTLEAWCGGQLADRCVEALTLVQAMPEQEACVVTVTDPTTPLFDLCQLSIPETIGGPETTNPIPGQIVDAERDRRIFIEEELPVLDARITEVIGRTHPTDQVTVGLVFGEPLSVPDMETFIEDVGGTWISAWRTDYICGPELAGQPQPSRFAFRDGVERAATARLAADQSEEPVVGRFIFEAAWAGMEHAARAIREPGVRIEAVEALVPVDGLSMLDGEPEIRTVRIAVTPEEAGDLTDPPVPPCET